MCVTGITYVPLNVKLQEPKTIPKPASHNITEGRLPMNGAYRLTSSQQPP